MRSLYNCIENLQDQYRKVQNYLEAREHLASVVVNVYEDSSSNLLQEITKLEHRIDDLLGNIPNLKKDILAAFAGLTPRDYQSDSSIKKEK